MKARTAHHRRRADVAAVAVLVGIFVLGLTAYGVLGGFLRRVDVAVNSMSRIEAVGAYAGRPTVPADTGPDNFAVFAANADGSLYAALVLHLDAPRQVLTVIGVPADVRLADGLTLASAFVAGPSTATKGLEQLVSAPMSHQFVLHLDECRPVISTAGGLNIDGPMDADAVEDYLNAAGTPQAMASRLSTVTAATLSTFTVVGSLTNPQSFDDAMDALTPCISVDATLTNAEVQSILVSLKIHTHDIGTTVLSAPGQAYSRVAPSGDVPVVPATTLRAALNRDDFASVPLSYPSSAKR